MRYNMPVGFLLCFLLLTVIPARAGNVVVVPQNAEWRYEATGTDLGTVWKDIGFVDTGWPAGFGILGYGETYINTTIPYGPDPGNKYRTTYFRIGFNLALDPAQITRLIVSANYDDGCVIYLNGFEVARRSLPTGTIDYTTFATLHEGGAYEAIDISASIGKLVLGSNLLAVEVHQGTPGSSDLVWDAEVTYSTDQVEFLWSGAVTQTRARMKTKVASDGGEVRMAVSDNPAMTAPVYTAPDTADAATNNRVVNLEISGLTLDTRYYYMAEVNGVLDTSVQGQFRTFPDSIASFTFAFSSCAQTASAHLVFETMASLDPLFFLHMGDFHYQNIAVNDRNVFRATYDLVLASPTQSLLHRSAPIVYIWDDHDYGPNNSDSTAPGREASRLTYREYVPHYDLPAGLGDAAIYQSFAVGRVKFIITDCRSARSPYWVADDPSKTMLGTSQKAWFKQELLDAQGVYPLVVWVNSLPWIGTTGDDGWYRYTYERREIANFIKDNNITGLCQISGDSHMIAIDDGTNSDYATGGGAAFPVMQAAALDRSGSVKGGPYSHGTYPGPGQFGLMTVTDAGGPFIDVQWSGRNAANAELVGLQFSAFAGYGPGCDCSSHGDVASEDGFYDAVDLSALIDVVFFGAPQPTIDPTCPHIDRGDLNCDGADDSTDLAHMIDLVYFGGALPCDPCACAPYPTACE